MIRIRAKIKILILLAIFSCITTIWFLFFHTSVPYECVDITFNVTCYAEPGNKIPYVDDKFQPKKHSIFFLETSCRGGLNSRQACAVEAAARLHPFWDIHVFFISPVRDLKHNSLSTLRKFRNVKFSRLNIEEYAKGTPLENFVTSGAWVRTMYVIAHTSDLLRYLTLYKWGGIYLDLDTVVVKPLEDLSPNWGARESDVAMSEGAIAFSYDQIGRMMAENTVRDFVKNWRGDIWNNNGPLVMYRVLSHMCGTEDVINMNAEICNGFEVYNQTLFYPIKWLSALEYFKPPTTTYPDVYMHHVWNQITKNTNVPEGSLYDLLAKEHCPDIYTVYGKDFGIAKLSCNPFSQ